MASLPDNEHRWAFVVCLMLQKKGLKAAVNHPVSGSVNVSLRRWKTIRKNLVAAGLLDQAGNVIGFDDSQISPEAKRKRAQRVRDNERDMSRGKSRQIQIQRKKILKESPDRVELAARELCLAFNQVKGKNVGPNFSNRTAVKRILDMGHTPEDIVAVARFRLHGNPEWAQTPESLIRKERFEGFLEAAKNSPDREEMPDMSEILRKEREDVQGRPENSDQFASGPSDWDSHGLGDDGRHDPGAASREAVRSGRKARVGQDQLWDEPEFRDSGF